MAIAQRVELVRVGPRPVDFFPIDASPASPLAEQIMMEVSARRTHHPEQ
jgi:hypothetical protein